MSAPSLYPNEQHLGLMTDFHALVMAAGFYARGMADRQATFELSIRAMPAGRNYLIAAGLAQVIHYLLRFSVSPEQIRWLRQQPAFAKVPVGWYEKLDALRFEGDIWAMPEGTPCFPPSPILRITAPLMVAQLLETYLVSTIMMQTMVASKASRIVTAAQGRALFDFGSRRAHGPQAGMLAARAAYIAGFDGTSHTEAARRLHIPVIGTQTHSWIMAFRDETDAFRQFGEVFPNLGSLVVDTYNTLEGVKHAIASGAPMQAIRLDSGNLLELSRECRKLLNAAGHKQVKIIASGDLNESKIQALVEANAPIDAFGVGTEMVTSQDEPSLGCHYKLVEIETEFGLEGRLKNSTDKQSLPYAKQVYRFTGADDRFEFDEITRTTETLYGDPLLLPIMKNGELVEPMQSTSSCRQHCQAQRALLPERLLALATASEPYRVRISKHLEREAERLLSAKPDEYLFG